MIDLGVWIELINKVRVNPLDSSFNTIKWKKEMEIINKEIDKFLDKVYAWGLDL